MSTRGEGGGGSKIGKFMKQKIKSVGRQHTRVSNKTDKAQASRFQGGVIIHETMERPL